MLRDNRLLLIIIKTKKDIKNLDLNKFYIKTVKQYKDIIMLS